MNKYEKSLMFNITVMKIGFAIIALVNLFFPVYKDEVFQFSLFQIGAVGIWFFGMLGGMGYLNQSIPIVQIGLLRIFEVMFYVILRLDRVNWWAFLIFIILDVAYLVFLLLDKANYSYEYEEVDNSDS